jgi:hypothetical protein
MRVEIAVAVSSALLVGRSPAGGQELTPTSFAGFYQAPTLSVAPAVPPYALPLDPAKIVNWQQLTAPMFKAYFNLAGIQSLVARNGFGVMAF